MRSPKVRCHHIAFLDLLHTLENAISEEIEVMRRYAHLAPSVKREAVTALDGPHGTNTSQNENARLECFQPSDSKG